MLNVLFDFTTKKMKKKKKKSLSIFLPDLLALLVFCVPEIISVLLKIGMVFGLLCNLQKLIHEDLLLKKSFIMNTATRNGTIHVNVASFFTFHFVLHQYKKSFK